MLRDPEEKAKRGYTNPKTIVWVDGREKLVGEDWKRRKQELYERCGKRCEYVDRGWQVQSGEQRCRATFATVEDMDPHHIRSRWKSRTDALANLLAVCRYHHRKLDHRVPRWGEKNESRQLPNREV
jgi:hypothetical protein